MRYLGVDYGSKKVGLALSDEAGRMGFPHGIVPTGELKDVFMRLRDEKKIDVVVVGESKDFAGDDNPIAREARVFAGWVREQGILVYFEPEMLTSAEARRQYESAEKTRAQKPTTPVDASAAALILTSYLAKHDHA